MRHHLLLGLALVLSAAACDTAPDASGPLGGRYALTLYENGEVVATGHLDLQIDPERIYPPSVSGDWRLGPMREDRTFGGGGRLRGSYDAPSVRLSLLVGDDQEVVLDAGVGLDGVVEGDVIRDEWGEGMSDGPSGSFVARC
jgi:hypothetical protein